VAVAGADALAWKSSAWSQPLFWLGLALIVLPVAGAATARNCSRWQRVALVGFLGLELYMVKVLLSPNGFTFGDELMRLRTAQDIYLSGTLFQPNPLNDITALYPGFELVTAVLARVGDTSLFVSGLLLVGGARLVAILAVFVLIERSSGSGRIGAAAAVVYACNPNFLFEGAQFSYESVGLPLALAAAVAVSTAGRGRERRVLDWCIAIVIILATVVTHHAASYALAVLLVAWALTSRVLARRGSVDEWVPATFAVIATASAGAWLVFVAPATSHYLTSMPVQGVHQLVDILTSGGSARAPFTTRGVTAAPLAERAVGFGSVAVLLVGLLLGLVSWWRRRRPNALAVVLVAGALLYPLSLALRLTAGGQEAANRASEYLFLPLGLVIGGLWVRLWRRTHARMWRLVSAVFVTIAFAGGTVIGWAHTARLPGPYLVAAGSRSITPQSVAAVRWLLNAYGPDHRVVADSVNADLAGSIGRQTVLAVGGGGHFAWPLFFGRTFGKEQLHLIRQMHIQFVIVDQRLTTSIPYGGWYISQGEPDRRLTSRDLAKFDRPPLSALRVYTGGPIQIYDVKPLWNRPRRAT
jgi:hypothetical protein